MTGVCYVSVEMVWNLLQLGLCLNIGLCFFSLGLELLNLALLFDGTL